ncbi:GmrSD restriction endonuclease domain-containing protein, partial [Mesomycoplasma ovipneumoniae]
MAKKKVNKNGNSAKNNNLKPWKIGTAIFIYIQPFIEDLGQIINKKHLDYKVEDNKKIVPCSQFAHKKITTKDWEREKYISWSTFRQRVDILESLQIVSKNEKNDPPVIRLKIKKDLANFYKQNRDEWDGNSTFRHNHIKNIALDLFEKFISSFKKANKAIDKKLNSICFNLLLSFDGLYLNSKYKEILVKNSGKNDDVIKGAIESFGSFWKPIMEDIKGDKERNILISKIENYLQKTIEILEKGEINNSQNLVVDSKIKNNESKFINTEDLEIKDEKLNKNNSEVLDMKDEFEFVDVKDENEQVNEDDEPIKSKTSIDKILINEIMKAEIKNDYIKNDNNINLVREKSKNVSSETITVQEYLQKFHEYKIYLPFFQRNYTWDPGLIANFFDLIFKEFDTNENFLFLNTIIFAEKKASEGFWIVDGQQRTVSILLILISILKMASHFGENIFLEMSSIYQTISKILENFSKNNSQYIPLLNYFKNNEKMDNTIFSRNIHKIIEKLCEIKTNKNSVDWINDFTNFILNKILLTLIRISEIKDEQFAKLFISINVQSKPIHVVDLITSRVNEESQQEQIPYVKLIQQYFGGEKENKKKLGAFLQNQQYFIEDEFNTQNTENNLFSLYQQLDNLLNKWTNNKALTKETLEEFVKKILVFEYAYVGHINVLSSKKDITDNDGIKVLIQKFKEIIHRNELAFINLQINTISKKGANNPYSLIIQSAIKEFEIFDGNLDLTEKKENLELFSSVLFQIEKSKIIYYSNFRGQSLRKGIYT